MDIATKTDPANIPHTEADLLEMEPVSDCCQAKIETRVVSGHPNGDHLCLACGESCGPTNEIEVVHPDGSVTYETVPS